MKHFTGRQDAKYIDEMINILDINNLIDTAIPIQSKNGNFDRVIRLDFFGLSGTTLLDIGKNFTDGTIAKAFEKICASMKIINDQRTFFKVRFLFAYMYSDFAFNLIEAEKTQNRATIEDTTHNINFEFENDISEIEFYSSSTFRNQISALLQIQKLTKKYQFGIGAPNKLVVRFTTLPINFCGLIINNHAFFDSYSYAKKEKASELLSFSMPVFKINKQFDKEIFDEIDDHFRYLWNHETTMFCEDATEYDKNKPNSLAKIKKPDKISLNAKATRIYDLSLEIGEKHINETHLNAWKIRVLNKIWTNSRDFQTFSSQESIFIACSWEESEDKLFTPNKIANGFSNLITNCFYNTKNPITTLLVEPMPSKDLDNKIYSHMSRASLALIICTKDVEGKNGDFFCAQNVIHELGFTMNRLRARETGKVLILKEKGLKLPTNVGNYEYIEFDRDKFILRFFQIIVWLKDRCTTFTKEDIISVFILYENMLNQAKEHGVISPEECLKIIRRISDYKENNLI